MFASNGGLRGGAMEWRQTNSTTTNPRCYGNETWDKIGYNSACVRDISEMFVCNRGFSGSRYWMTPYKFYHDRPPLPWPRNLRQNRLSAITRLVQEISLRGLCLSGGYRGRAIEWCQSNFKTTDPGCHDNEIWVKPGYNSARIENIAVSLAPSRGYSWVGYWMMSYKFYHDQPRCHGNENAYNSSCIRDISEMLFTSTRGFSGTGYEMMSIKFYNDRLWLPLQRKLRQNRLRSYRKYCGAACA